MYQHVYNRKALTNLFAKSISEVSCSTEKQSEHSVSGGTVASGKLQQNISCILQTFL